MRRQPSGPAGCLRVRRPGALCEVCRKPAMPLHVSLRTRAFTCDNCCLHCNPQVRLAAPRKTRIMGPGVANVKPAEAGPMVEATP
jgi:hypothetical protein